MLFGGRWGGLALHLRPRALLAGRRRRCSGRLLRRRFGVFGAGMAGESDSDERGQHAQAARPGITDSHVHCLRPNVELPPNRF